MLFSLIYIGDLINWDYFVVEQRKQTLVDDWGFSGRTTVLAYVDRRHLSLCRLLRLRSKSGPAHFGSPQRSGYRSRAALERNFSIPDRFTLLLLGLGLAALAAQEPLILDSLPTTSSGEKNLNVVFPVFVLNYFEPGFVGLVMVGLIAASMSSIDSALNSLAAVTVEDFIRPHLSSQTSPARLLLLGRACTILWGLFAVACAFQVENIAPTVLEAVNKVGSMVNGPLLALITSAILMKRYPRPTP